MHFSHVHGLLVGMPHFSHNGPVILGTLSWQVGHQRHPIFPHPPQTGGKIKSNPLQVHRYKRYDQGTLFTDEYSANYKLLMIWMAAGVKIMIMIDGKINKAIGMSILTGALCASSSAR